MDKLCISARLSSPLPPLYHTNSKPGLHASQTQPFTRKVSHPTRRAEFDHHGNSCPLWPVVSNCHAAPAQRSPSAPEYPLPETLVRLTQEPFQRTHTTAYYSILGSLSIVPWDKAAACNPRQHTHTYKVYSSSCSTHTHTPTRSKRHTTRLGGQPHACCLRQPVSRFARLMGGCCLFICKHWFGLAGLYALLAGACVKRSALNTSTRVVQRVDMPNRGRADGTAISRPSCTITQ